MDKKRFYSCSEYSEISDVFLEVEHLLSVNLFDHIHWQLNVFWSKIWRNFDEWLELFNPSGAKIDITGWWLVADDGSPNIILSGSISAGGYYLLERTDNETLIDIPARCQ